MQTGKQQIDKGEQIVIGKRLRFAREYLGLHQKDVAKALDIPRPSVSAIESGKRGVSAVELSRLSSLYRRPTSWLLEEEGAFDAHSSIYQATKELSKHDREQVLRFAEFLAGAGRPGTARPNKIVAKQKTKHDTHK